MEMLKFYVNNLLGPVFDYDLVMVRARVDNESEKSWCQIGTIGNGCENGEGGNRKRDRWRRQLASNKSKNMGDTILDPSGPKLIDGLQNWLIFYQLIGFINFPRMPLYVSIVYRLVVFILANYIVNAHFMFKILFSNLLDINHANPIFILMTILTFLMATLNGFAIIYTSTFYLQPLFKILETPRLCCVNRRTLNALGSNTLKYMLIFYLYHCLLYRMLASENVKQFVCQFNLFEFFLEYYSIIVYVYHIVGLAHIDFYVRTCFGAWLLALTANLEFRRARFSYLEQVCLLEQRQPQQQHQQQQQHRPSANNTAHSNPSGRRQQNKPGPTHGNPNPTAPVNLKFLKSHLFITLDNIQISLNTMDDHLEVERSIQTFSLVLINLLAFLGCGDHFLIAYDVLARSNDYYHGAILGLLSLNYIFLVMVTYSGDSFIYYALGKLVQTIEDEYFMQEDCYKPNELSAPDELDAQVGGDPRAQTIKQSLLIKRSDVLFCREFIVQFENHLGTPWSSLTFKSHLHIMGTFATLIAAQIIFESH